MGRYDSTMLARRFACLITVVALCAAAGCRKPKYDTSTPARTVDAMQKMVADGHPEYLLDLFYLEPRPVTYADGVTEASAIEDVRRKAKDMVAQLWRVSKKLKQRFPNEVDAEIARAAQSARRSGGGLGDFVAPIVTDPFGWVDANKGRLKVDDLSDGTASVEIDGKPVLGGVITMASTADGWKFTIPAELARNSEYFPDTREEWAVVAYFMLALENAMNDFEHELDEGKFRTLSQASERVGRMMAEGAAAQVVIYAMMQQNQPGSEKKVGPRNGAELQRDMGQLDNAMRRGLEGR